MPNSTEYDGAIATVLEEVRRCCDLEGLAVLDLSQQEPTLLVSYRTGVGGPNTVSAGQALLTVNPGGPAHGIASDKRPIAVCPWLLPPASSGGLMLWRPPNARRWAEAEHGLIASLAALLRALIGSGAGEIGIDRLTGLPNRRWFVDETDRHIERLDLDGQIGTLSLIDIDDLRRLNATLGRIVGDNVLVRLAGQLRATIRPGDIVARVGGDKFAVWQNGMDHLTAAERADALCTAPLFHDLPIGYRATFSIGIASRQAAQVEDVRTLLRRAHMAAWEVKSTGGGGWRVSHAVPMHRRSLP